MDRSARNRRLSLPTGTETLQLRESARQRRIAQRLEQVFELWGYTPAHTPLVDYFDVYRRLISEDTVRETYRAVDRQGEILAVRSDTTLFLAKQLGAHLAPDELPVRVYYNDQIVRAEAEHEIAHNEYRQAGVELVGLASREADLEVLLLALEALTAVGIRRAALHLGSMELVEAVASTRTDTDSAELAQALRRRSFSHPALTTLDADTRAILALMAGPDAFASRLETAGLPDDVAGAARDLVSLTAMVERVAPEGLELDVRVDPSEVGGHAYYTGISFAVYLPGVNDAVARGGRYDRLLDAFGFDTPSVGFSVYAGKLPAETPGAEEAPIRSAAGADFETRLADARSRRSSGERVRL